MSTSTAGAALADAKTPEDFLKAVDLLQAETVWQHPDYPDDRVACMNHTEICAALADFQRLPKGYDLMDVSTLRHTLMKAARDPAIRQRYEAMQIAKTVVIDKSAQELKSPTTQPKRAMSNQPSIARKIKVSTDRLQDQTGIALDALADVNDPPFIFNRARQLVRVLYDEKGSPAIVSLTESGVRGVLERCAEFVRIINSDKEKPVSPPMDVVRDIMSLPEWHTIPPITGITECPIIRQDGTIVSKEGYDASTRLYFAPSEGFKLPDIPEKPTEEDVKNSVVLLQEIFVDFPFVVKGKDDKGNEVKVDANCTNTIATLITLVIRPMISGNVMLAVFDKPMAGTGASLIAECIAMIATGRSAAIKPAPENDAEWRKMITATVIRGQMVSVVDNVESKLHAPSLAAVLTSKEWEDRILGGSVLISMPHKLVWLCTGNNVQLGGDLPRRCYWIRMDAESARPWQREVKFTHPDLLKWVERERGRIIAAILTVTRSWILAGRPGAGEDVPKEGGFEEWRDIVGGILKHCQITGFLANTEEMYAVADADTPQWVAFFSEWSKLWGEGFVTVAEITKTLRLSDGSTQKTLDMTEPSLLDFLPDALSDEWVGKKSFSRVFGQALSKMNGRVFTNNLQLQRGDKSHSAVTWRIKKVKSKKPDETTKPGS